MKKQLSILFCGILSSATLSACNNAYEQYDNAHLYSVGDFSYSATEVEKIEIDWLAGNIEIQQSQAETLSARENVTKRNNTEKMHYFLDGKTLKIEYCSSGYKGKIDESEKNLQLEIPKGVALEIDTKSASIAMGVVAVRSLSIESDSGDITGEKWTSDSNVEIDTESGLLAVGELIARNFDFDSRSGDVSIEKLNVSQIDGETKRGNIKFGILGLCSGSIETTGGNVTFTLLDGAGLSARFKSLTGKLKTEKQYDKQNRYLFEGTATDKNYWEISVDTVGGDLIVK